MNRSYTYKVAEHLFRITLPDIAKLWNAVEGPYKVFEVQDECSEDSLLFSLELSEQLPEGAMECIYDMPTEDGETVVKMYRINGGGWIFETSADHRQPICARIWASEDFSKAKIQLLSRMLKDATFGINNAAMLIFAFASACKGTVEMHASVIRNSGKAYLFLGKSGTGKSTHSSLWLRHIPGSELMNDDNPIVRVWDDGSVIAYGSPWSGKTPCYKNISAPVGAYVLIRQCPENKIHRMNVLESYSALFSSISGIKDDNSAIADGLNSSISRILSVVPCFLMDCRPDEEAAIVCSQKVIHFTEDHTH